MADTAGTTSPNADTGDVEQRWTRRGELPLAAAAVVFLVAYAWPILEPGLPRMARHGCTAVVYVVWAVFAVDYLVRLGLSRSRWRFVRRNVVDLVSIVLPVLRPLRLLRLVALVRVLNRRATTSLLGRVALYVSSSTVLVVFVASLAMLDAERGQPHAQITTFGDALWWAAATVMTVGYGDRVPVTGEGRLVAVGLMVAGIALLGIVTASIASWLLGRIRAAETNTEDRLTERIDEMHRDIVELKHLVLALGGSPASGADRDTRGAADREW